MKNDPNYSKGYIEKTSINGLLVYKKEPFEDHRGYFREALKLSLLEEALGERFHVKTWNFSITNKNVLRGIHSESCAKLVFPVHGEGVLAVVDLRPDSPTFGKYELFKIGKDKDLTIFKGEGMGIGWVCASDEPLEVQYLMDKEYDQIKQQGVLWNDPDINIPWPVTNPTLSDRDRTNPTLRSLFPEKFQ